MSRFDYLMVRITKEEKELLKQKAKEKKQSISNYVRELLGLEKSDR